MISELGFIISYALVLSQRPEARLFPAGTEHLTFAAYFDHGVPEHEYAGKFLANVEPRECREGPDEQLQRCVHFKGSAIFIPNRSLTGATAAAMSITTLYKSSLHTSKRAYNAGYGAALQDLLDVIQQGVSVGGVGGTGSEGGMTIGRVMDWVEARLEAVRAREEEEEEEERERECKSATSAKVAPVTRDKEKSDAPPRVRVHLCFTACHAYQFSIIDFSYGHSTTGTSFAGFSVTRSQSSVSVTLPTDTYPSPPTATEAEIHEGQQGTGRYHAAINGRLFFPGSSHNEPRYPLICTFK